jgi:hypothetical protein
MSSSNNSIRVSIKLTSRKRKRIQPGFNTSSSVPSILNRFPDTALATKNDSKENASRDVFDNFELPSDILLAFDSLLQRHSYATCGLNYSTQSNQELAFVMSSMLSSSLWTTSCNEEQNIIASSVATTDFHIELERLCRNGEIKILQLHGLDGEDDVAVFRMKDYLRGVNDALIGLKEEMRSIGDLYLACTQQFHGTYVEANALLRAMNRKNLKRENYVLNSEKWISELVRIQLLLPRNRDGMTGSTSTSFWFHLPKLSVAAKLISKVRKRMLQRLKRAPNQELKRTMLETSVKDGFMGPFHVRDLLSKGLVRIKDTANGQFVKINLE